MSYTARTLAALIFGATLVSSSIALADAPPMIPLQGTLYDLEGEPITGSHPVEVTLYADAAGTTPVWSDTMAVNFAGGHFTIYLGESDPLNTVIFRDYDEVFVGVAVDGDAEMPLFAIATSPYAAFANYCGDAETLAGRDVTALIDETVTRTDTLYAPLSHGHEWSEISGVPSGLADGDDVLSEADVDAYVANNGYLTGVSWGEITGIPSGFADGIDNDTQLTEAEVDGYVADNGFLTSGSAVGWGQLTGIPLGFADGVDNDSDTTYSAGSGLSLAGTTFSVNTSQVQSRVTGTCPAGESIRTIAADGTVTCEADDNTTYSAGTGLSLSGTTLSVNTAQVQSRVGGTCAVGSAIRAIAADGTVTCEATSGGGGITLPFFPNALTTSCGTPSVGGANFGSTTQTTNQYIANVFYSETDSNTGLRNNYTSARLQVTCRGSGVLELMNSCSTTATPVATITCSGGARPWTATSEEFDPGSSASWNLRVRATSGTIEWANPQVILQ